VTKTEREAKRPSPASLFCHQQGSTWESWGNAGRIVSIDFDQTTMANMTAALEQICNRLPPDSDTHENRKRIADAMIAFARSGGCTLRDFQSLGSETLKEMTQPSAAGPFDPARPFHR
jgi:hypothetical protein